MTRLCWEEKDELGEYYANLAKTWRLGDKSKQTKYRIGKQLRSERCGMYKCKQKRSIKLMTMKNDTQKIAEWFITKIESQEPHNKSDQWIL